MVKVESLLQRGQSTGQNPSIGGTREFLSDFHVGMCLWYLAEAEVRGSLHKKPTTNSLKSQTSAETGRMWARSRSSAVGLSGSVLSNLCASTNFPAVVVSSTATVKHDLLPHSTLEIFDPFQSAFRQSKSRPRHLITEKKRRIAPWRFGSRRAAGDSLPATHDSTASRQSKQRPTRLITEQEKRIVKVRRLRIVEQVKTLIPPVSDERNFATMYTPGGHCSWTSLS